MKKTVVGVLAICLIVAAVFGIAGIAGHRAALVERSLAEPEPAANAQTVRSGESYRMPFDLDAFITGSFEGDRFTPAAFRGVVTDISNRELTWVNGSGEESGPYYRTILELSVEEDYCGNLHGGKISALIVGLLQNDTEIKVGGEYVFLCSWLLDSVYFDTIRAKSPDSYENDSSLHEADVIVGSEWCSIFPIEEGNVRLYYEYLDRIDHSYERSGDAYVVPENDFAEVYDRITASVEV